MATLTAKHTAATRLLGYIQGMRERGTLDDLPAGHLANIDRYLADFDAPDEEEA